MPSSIYSPTSPFAMAIDYANLFVPVLLAFVLGAHGQRKKSLTTWGGITAFLVGSGIMSGAVRVFGVGMIVFYVLGTLTTKCMYMLDQLSPSILSCWI